MRVVKTCINVVATIGRRNVRNSSLLGKTVGLACRVDTC